MIIIRYKQGNQAAYGLIERHRVYASEGDLFGVRSKGAEVGELADVELLAPCTPTKIVCIGRNFPAHAQEHGAVVPAEPLIFLKPPSAVIGPEQPILLPPLSQQVEHEAEIAVVIGRRCRNVSEDAALDYVLGYTCGNDVTARDLQRQDGQWSRAKGFDTFCPLGPWIVTPFDASDAAITCRVNGRMRQFGLARDMVFPIPQLIAYISAVMTLEPGDVILTGTPSGVGPLNAGDVVEVEVEGIGVLRNPVVAS
jgi:2-keto-4-pentenoate hydratase/2-oxohepta-3-ene-1,7-dioic acid hydratase in catechol pathway